MAGQQIDIVANLLMKVDGAEAGINKLKSSLSKLKMPEGLENSFKKSFANLDSLFAKYKSQIEKGFDTKGDVTAFNKTSKALDAELTRISKHFTELTGKEINFKVKSDDIIRTEKELEKLIEQKAQLSKESLKFEIKGGKDGLKDVESILLKLKEAAGRTKTGENIGGALDFLKSGDVQTAISLLEKASVSVKRFKQEKQDAFKSETGFDMNSILTTMISMLSGAEGKFGDVNAKIIETKNNLTNFQAEQIQKAGNYAEELSSKMENSASEIRQADGAMQDFARSSQSMSQQLGDLQQSTQYFFSLRNMINLLKRGIDEAIQSVKELDAAMTETAVVTDYKVSDMWNMLPQYTQLANQLGATTQGAYETMTLYFQQGLDQQQAFELGAETMKMARIAGLDYAETTDMMTAALRGFNMELNETSAKRVNDVYSELAAITASDTEELGTAMQRTASIAHSAGSSFEGTTAFLAQAIETTREPAENIGTAMKTIIARFQEMKKNPLEISEVEGEEVDFNKIDAALKSIGVDLVDTNGQFRDFDKVMLEISQKWDTLSQSQQRYIATTAAGSRQQSRFIAMVSDYDRTMQLMEAANNSAGASDEQFGKTMDSLESKLNKLHNAWQQFTMGIANNGMIKFAVDGITKLISGVNDLIDTFSLGSGIIKSFLSLFTAFTGLKAGGKVINSLIGGLGGMVDPTSNFNIGFGRGMTGNKAAGNAALAAQINQPIVAGLKEVVGAIREETVAERQLDSRFADNTNAYAQRDAFKNASAALKDSFKNPKTFTIDELRKQLGGLTSQNQDLLMRSNASTFNTATNALLLKYAGKDTKKYNALKAGERNLNDARKAGQLTAEQYFQHLQDPSLLKDALLRSGIKQDNPAYQYLDTLNNEITNQVATQTKADIESAWRQHKLAQARYGEEYQTTDEDIQQIINKEILSEDGQKRRRGQVLKEKGLNPEFTNTAGGKILQSIGRLGGGISQAGMGIQAFGSILMSSANPALQTFGAALTSIGGLVGNLGMAISGVSSGFSAIAGSKLITSIAGSGTVFGGLMTAAGALTGGLMLLVGAIAGVAIAIKKHREKIKEDAEKVTTNYKEKNEKHQSNISNLESYREDFARLSAGVDSNGMNINLDTADYEHYLEITRALADINPDIVDGYNAQGNAIINNKNALEDTLAIEKERQAEAFDTYTSPDSTNTLIKARNLSRQERRGEANPYGGRGESYQGELLGGYEFAPQADMRKQAKKIGQTLSKGVKEGWISEDALSDFDIKIDDLAKGTDDAVSAFEQNYDKVKARISSKMDSAGDELKDSTKESMLDAFSGYNEAADELDELITPLYEQTLAKVGKEFQVPDEFKSFFNQGIKDIVSDANITDIDGEIAKLTTSFSALGENGSEYSKILEDVEIAQDKYAASLDANAYDEFVHGTNGAVERIQALKSELLDGVDTTQGYGKAISEFLDNEIDKIENFTKAGAANLQQALNTMTSEIEAAEGVLENFNKIAEGSTYGKAASNMSQIFETATAEEHALGEGDQAFWAGAEALVGRKNLLEHGGTDKDKALKQMKEVQEMLKGGQEGWDNFKIKWFDSADAKLFDDLIDKGLKLDDNGWIDEIDENINPEIYDQLADKLNMSKESLIAMLNLGRQFGEISFTNVEDVRKALATSESTIKNLDTGAVFVKQDALEAEMTSAGIDLNKQQEIEKDLQENYNTQLIKSADEITKTNNQFAEMGITSMESLVKTFDDTGQFTKDEIKEYAEKWAEFNGQEGELANFDKYWQNNQEDTEFGGIPSSLDSIESILSAIQSILASQRLSEGYLDNPTADASKKWLFGGEGEDTAAQKFWKGHGSGINGEITTSEFNQTSKELTDFIAKGKDYIDQLDKVQPANETERKQIEAEKEAYEYQVSRAETYLKEGTEAYNTQVQNKIDAINQDKEIVDKGFADLLGSITPESINTDAAQSTLNQLYEAAINNTPAILTDGLKAQMESLGIDIQKAIDAGLIVDENGILASAQKTGQDTAQAGVEGNISGQQGVDTTPAETAGEQKGKETGEAGVQGNASGQSSVVPPAVQHAEEYDNRGGSSQPEVAPKVDTSQIDEADQKVDNFKAKLSEGADFNINVTGVNDLDKAASAADKVAKNSGNKTVGVTTTFDSSAATAGIASLNAMNAKIKVGADTSTALTQAEKARKSIDSKSATIDVKVRKTGISAITVDGHTWNISTKARGQNNYGYFAPPSFGSAAKGRYGQLGPKGKGGLTLTGELGYEVAWLPSENRSMILGANGPQMLNLPSDAVVWNHEQSKKILQQKAIPAGSHYVEGENAEDPRGGKSSKGKKKKKKSKKKSKKSSKKDTTPTINNWSIEEAVRYNIDQSLASITEEISLRTKEIEKNLEKIGTTYNDIVGTTQAQIAALDQVKKKNQELLASNQRQLADYRAQQQYVSWTDANGESQRTLINIASYLNADGSVNTGAIQGAGGRALQEAIYKEISSAKSIVDGINNANKAIKDADEQIADLGKKVSEAFYQWENELTEVYSLTQRINNEVSFTNRFTSQVELELSKLNAGFGDTAKSIENAKNVLTRNNATIQAQIKNQQQMIAARQRELEAALSYEDEVNKYKKLEAKTDWDSEATKIATLEWAKNLETGARLGYKYVADSIFKDIDGSIQYQIDWEKFNADNEANPYSKADYEAIKKYLDDLNSAATEFNDSIKEQTDFIKQTYDALREYQDYISDMEDTLIKGVEEEIEEAKNNAKQLSDSITGALKDLLDEVKRKLDERRKQEDNAKTERDISQKQQRLAALRADTAGGHQVEIAQLEKEIADSQQSYQRTLEDQLLDRLQQQADAAAQQRERQIELAETGNQIAAANNKELVDMWLRDPVTYKEQIRNAWLEANGYDEKGEAGQYVLENQFESDFAQLVTAVEETNFTDHFNELTADTNSLLYTLEQLTNGQLGRYDELSQGQNKNNALLDATERNTTSILTEIQKGNLANLRNQGVDANTLKSIGYDASTLINLGGYQPNELQKAGFTAKEVFDAGITDLETLKNAGYDAKDIKSTGAANAQDLKGIGFTATDLKDLFSLDELIDATFDAKNLKDADFDAKALRDTGKFTASDLRAATYTAAQLKAGGYNQYDLGAAGYGYNEARALYGLNDLKSVTQYATQANQEQAAIDAQNAWNAKVNAYNGAIYAAHARGTVDKYTLADAFNKGAAIGYGVDAVARALAAGDGSGGVTWKEVAKAAKKLGYGRTTVASWSPGSSALKNATTSKQWKKYAIGGLADYTGPAWLDGTPSKPELVLNAKDTQNFLVLRDVLSSAMKSTGAVNNSYGGDATYEININVDHLNNDYDVDKVAERVKKIIVKDSSYRNVTQVRNLR